jgi:dsDNA-specific endonuclease/ATPase MutS2
MEAQFARYDKMLGMLSQSVQEAERQHAFSEGWRIEHEEWRESVMDFNKAALELLAKTVEATQGQAERAAEWEKLRKEAADQMLKDQRQMIELLGKICGELHDLGARLAAPEGRADPDRG